MSSQLSTIYQNNYLEDTTQGNERDHDKSKENKNEDTMEDKPDKKENFTAFSEDPTLHGLKRACTQEYSKGRR